MFYTYVLMSEKDDNFYIGFTKDLRKRIQEHKGGKVEATAPRRPLNLVYYEACIAKNDAIIREKNLKTGLGRKFIKRRLKTYLEGRA